MAVVLHVKTIAYFRNTADVSPRRVPPTRPFCPLFAQLQSR